MWPLPMPTMTVARCLSTCAAAARDPDLQLRLGVALPRVESATNKYVAAAAVQGLHSERSVDYHVAGVTDKEMTELYDRMARATGSAHPIYLEIKGRNTRCPMCGTRVVSTLDHFLPQSDFPALAVSPQNLVPACSECNKKKRAYVATSADSTLSHAYFDNFDNGQWLWCAVVEVSPVTFRFYVSAPAHWSPIAAARAQHHFDRLNLEELYVSHASQTFASIRKLLTDSLDASGTAGVREQVEKLEASCRHNRVNAWDTAMFGAMVGSAWFLSGGFV